MKNILPDELVESLRTLRTSIKHDQKALGEKLKESSSIMERLLGKLEESAEKFPRKIREAFQSLHQQVDEIQVQLALGKMEGSDLLNEKVKPLIKSIEEANIAIRHYEQESYPAWQEVKAEAKLILDSAEKKAHLLFLDLLLMENYAEGEAALKKEQLTSALKDLEKKVASKNLEVKDAIHELSEIIPAKASEVSKQVRTTFRKFLSMDN